MKNNRKGFTLIEMLVVVAIIGLLASVTVVGIGGARQKARDTKRVADVRSIQTWAEANYTNAYPDAAAWTAWSGKPSDPSGGSYTYVRCTNDQTYVAKAVLENAANMPSTEKLTGTVCGVSCSEAVDYCVGNGAPSSTGGGPLEL